MNDSNSTLDSRIFLDEEAGGVYFIVGAILIGLLIIVANSIVLVLYKRSHGLRTFSNFLLVNLALSDAVTGLFIIPLTILQAYIDINRTFLFFAHAFSSAGIYTVVLNITMVVLQRYLELCHPYLSDRMRAIQYKKVVCIVPWVLVNVVAVIPFIWHSRPDYNPLISDTIYSYLTMIVFFMFPLTVIILAMAKMIACIKDIQKRSHLHMFVLKNRDAKIVIIFGLMTLNFVIAWLPFATIRILEDANVDIAMNALGAELLFLLRCLSSLINPLIYTGIKQDFRKALKRIFKTNFPRKEYKRKSSHLVRVNGSRDDILSQGTLNSCDLKVMGRKHSIGDKHVMLPRYIFETEV